MPLHTQQNSERLVVSPKTTFSISHMLAARARIGFLSQNAKARLVAAALPEVCAPFGLAFAWSLQGSSCWRGHHVFVVEQQQRRS